MSIIEPTFTIGNVAIHGDLILSPMVGYSDVPYRLICRRMGAAMSYTSSILDEATLYGSNHTNQLLRFLPEERPMAIQLLSNNADTLVEAAQRVMELEPDLIDLNLGCPARHVTRRGRGSALLLDPPLIGQMVSRLVQAVPVPVTAKIRLGWDEQTRNHLEVARILEDSGIAAIAVHGRTREQGYGGQADWQAIAEVREAVRVPVLANGDVRAPEDIAAIKRATGCQGVLIGRGAVGNPWIFARRDAASVSHEQRLAMIRHHLEMMLAYYGEQNGLVLFRKHLIKYVQGWPDAALLRRRLMTSETPDALLWTLSSWVARPLANAS
ncbi:MAG: tRNA dihydrouridine synthase DusB [Chloroflexi bacterium]|nr:tRNA dihydrouridine synthase DusB [Chloroflexota bacterium]